ncbi:hypothetical protein Ping_1908 [Psychromonas ingrahamii 37]|uniref:DUF4145 domain-containing protein n=1 Tax=Psychromonas ingrahamii (strain DSM 17664 / CCUG 51855 / 37) TaxID=357804 RepID=A1SW18_PSYIN|nr:DUF4145 domain-containing protein [Psychromonas ingrahamii]ABM03683.1 hypothetical protein Ping_1908 [Psychromonas ingrahamii 37]
MGQLAYLPNSTQLTNNYLFIEHSFPELYRLSQEVEKHYSTDHSCCLLKARMFVELWCHEVGAKLNLYPPITGDLNSKIKQISYSHKVPGYILDTLNKLRIEGNKSAHILKRYDGSWSCEYALSKYKLDNLMKSLLEITQYLAYKLNMQNDSELNVWQEPTKLALQEDIYGSLLGNKEATYSLAKHYAIKMQQATEHNQISGKENKAKMQLLQHDLAYWLARAHKQDHQETWLLYAEVYKNKFLPLPENITVESCFKEALKNDDSGEVPSQYAAYLLQNSQHKRGVNFIHQAAEKANHDAIKALQTYYYEKDQKQYLKWVDAGINAYVKQSFILDFAHKLDVWEKDKENQLLQKQVKTALINAQSHQSEGLKYFQGYCDYYGYWGKNSNPEQGLNLMVDSHEQLPAFLHYEDKLFNLLKNKPEHSDLALEISNRALSCTSGTSKAQMQFDLAMLIWQKLRADHQVKCSHSLKVLIRESAKSGCVDAQQFMKSPKGKALMQDNSVICQNNGKKSVDRKKLQQAKKNARRAKR